MTITLSVKQIRWSGSIPAKKTGYAVVKANRTSAGVTYEAFSTHRTEDGAGERLAKAARRGVGNLHVARLTA